MAPLQYARPGGFRAGVGVVGVLSGLFASWFMEPAPANAQHEEGLLELRALRQDIQELRARLDRTPPS